MVNIQLCPIFSMLPSEGWNSFRKAVNQAFEVFFIPLKYSSDSLFFDKIHQFFLPKLFLAQPGF